MSDSLRGCFLVAGCQLRDPNFFKTAVLMIDHGPDGAMGLVVNRPSSISVTNALAGQLDLPPVDDLVFVGGPVEPSALIILHSSPDLDPEEQAVIPGLYVASSADVFEQIVESLSGGSYSEMHYRVYSGCAGWAPGQLEGELARGDWFVIPASASLVFNDDPYAVWDALLQEVYRSKRLLPLKCEHPEWN
ncbi:MAG: YqgE/AlgH family protein [Planctomycetaceae bacterium]|nr:YqgE/AlgH family protein [Planctomycetaceae bacterium]